MILMMITIFLNQYVFSVSKFSTKQNIKDAIENTFNVTVLKVNTLNAKPKTKRDRMRKNRLGKTTATKKAIITLKAGDSIDLA